MAYEVSAHWRQLGITLFSLKSGVLKFTPKVFDNDKSYTVVISEPDTGKHKKFTDVKVSDKKVQVDLK